MPKQPAYLTIKNAILTKIHAGIWHQGSAIPAEISLAEKFGVSRMTVNRALKELENERVLERRQGSGTFVAQQKYNHTFIEVRNITKDIIDAGKTYRAEVVLIDTLDIHKLNLSDNHELSTIFFGGAPQADDKVYQVSIIHYADEQPVQYEERWVNAKVIPEFIEQDFTKVNTSDFLIAHVPLEAGEYTIFAKNPTETVKSALQMADNEPALLLTRRTRSQGQAVTIVNMWHAGSRYQFGGQL